MRRGELWWASLGPPRGSGPGYRRPVIIVQSNDFNDSRIATVVAVVVTTNLDLEQAPGNFKLTRKESGLNHESVVNISQIITFDRRLLGGKIGRLPNRHLARLEAGLRLLLAL